MRRRTSASISWLETDTSNAGSLHGGRRRTQSGLSHSWERPTSISPAPRAQTISVALASNETMRTRVIVVCLAVVVHKRRKKDSKEVSLPPVPNWEWEHWFPAGPESSQRLLSQR